MSSTTVCVADTSVIPFPTLDPTLPPSITAASPLPHVPCRPTRPTPLFSLSDTSLSDSSPPHSDTPDYPLQSRSAAFIRHDSDSSSVSSTPSDEIRPTIIPRSKRFTSHHSVANDSRDIFTPASPASTPVKPPADASFTNLESEKQTPLRDPSDEEDTLSFPIPRRSPVYNVGKLRLEGSIGKEARHASDPLVASPSAPAAGTPNVKQPLQTIRKKSGQLVKSSLKSARRPELHVLTDGPFAKSEPTTPTHTKAVHFDSKLEHVKLFLAEQKPLAVSRDGSPTSDTSGDEFPSFIYGKSTHEDRQVRMLVPNMPSSPSKDVNVALHELVLSQDQRTIMGSVRVRNIAYEKWLAARFTLDWWQTTSEVTARYEKSVEDSTFDIFSFSIRLSDIWSRIEEKTIFMALRYTVSGQEYWDNNAGQNYHIKFFLARPSDPASAVDNETSLRDLNSRLEDVAKARSAPISASRLGRSFSADHQYSSFAVKPSSSSRYDFAKASKTPWIKNASPLTSRHTRTHTYPSGAPATAAPTAAPWSKPPATEQVTPPRQPMISLGSPREVMDGTPTPPARSEPKPALLDSPSFRERNHRRGYVGVIRAGSPTLHRTPAGSPLKFDVATKDAAVHLPRTRSYPFVSRNMVPPLSIQTVPEEAGSDASTPLDTETSQTSSSGSTPSYTPLFSPVSEGGSEVNYKQFLDQFCFFTGADPTLHESLETVPRSHSASSIDRLLLQDPLQAARDRAGEVFV